ncbi:MAG: hypothetical protein JXB88_18025 [Spirochaetales bacterium]|nr:hypothetical protein [Spirochaetales bacterium]
MKNKVIGIFFLFCFISCICILFAYVSCAPPSISQPEPTSEPTPGAEITPDVTEDPIPTAIPTAVPTATPIAIPTAVPTGTPTATSDPGKVPGDVWVFPENQTVSKGGKFTTEIHVNSGEQKVASYGITITYQAANMVLDTEYGDNGVIEGDDGFIVAINAKEPGKLVVTGFDTGGTGPGADLHLLIIHWTAVETGTMDVILDVDILTDPATEKIGTPNGIDGSVKIE